ncbi:MAG: NUDIX domain-containing protein [Dehalococcoidia bacterium]|nr:NUDIX domain-containing protein [Dehalococcoidia bacterium]
MQPIQQANENEIATVIVIFAIKNKHLNILLVKRSAEPEDNKWALPGGTWTGEKKLQETATARLQLETGAKDVYLEQLFTISGLNNYNPKSIAVCYFALVNEKDVTLRAEKTWQPKWFNANQINSLAFKNKVVIEKALERIESKLQYSNVAYSLLPNEFTLRELQETYEAIIGKKFDRRNFRKSMISNNIIIQNGKFRKSGAYRPAALYKFISKVPTLF